MERRDMLADSLLTTKTLMARYLAGFDETNSTSQAPHLPNHPAWILGHCALTMHRVANMFQSDPPVSAGPLTSGDFLTGDGTKGDAEHFDSESVSFGSKPLDDPRNYPTYARSVQIFDAACDRLASVIRTGPDAKLDQKVKWGPLGMELPLWSLAMRMVFHNGMHTGQLADLRRALGFRSIFS
ncbi:MAG: DinB family protein [Pyrinomonadaceae bacterium]|nr:DinB family protein [Phycisphaerales bacterium]